MSEFPPRVVWQYGSVWSCVAVSTPGSSGRVGPVFHVELCGCVFTVGLFGRVVPSSPVGPVGCVGLVGRVGPSGHVGPCD